MNSKDKLIFVGVISSAYGIKGEAIIKSFTSPVGNICKLPLVDKKLNGFRLTLIRKNAKEQLICQVNSTETAEFQLESPKIFTIDNRTAIEKLKGLELFCLRSSMPTTNENEFYIEDLKNLPVLDQNHQQIGIINNIFNFGAGDLIEIEFGVNKTEILPFTKEIFPEITDSYVVINSSSFPIVIASERKST